MGLKQRALRGVQAGLYLSGLSWLYVRAASPTGAVILMYHSISTPERRRWHDPANTMDVGLFRRQIEFLARRRRVVSFSDLMATIAAGNSPPAGTVAITFDDGYLDNLEVAAPILAEFDLPAILYLCTGYVGRGENQWVDRLNTIIETRKCDALILPGHAESIDLSQSHQLRQARRDINTIMIEASLDTREEILSSLAQQLEPRETGPRLTMTWPEARTMRDEFDIMELGVHTADHCDLRSASAATRQRELATCCEDFRRELGYQPQHFSFPYGRSDAACRELVASHGLASAIASGAKPQITSASDPYWLSRVTAPESRTFLRYLTGGAYPSLPLGLFGRS
jgi:peptidoglycan/xylan/chitin deacetylase (PgdA/CDA1 family)